ncbi:MAG: hypothetical protein HY959_14080 [Ignavibacteriae bacterium]|nr:hypothetical protein [Ignavibacteriota bacterium]
MDNIKNKVHEFAKIAKECPDNLQEKCFELLLSNYLLEISRPKLGNSDENTIEKRSTNSNEETHSESKQDNIQEKDLHVKVKQFMKKESVSIEQISQIFYLENGILKPLYDDLKTTKASESQLRIALLESLKNAIQIGSFHFNGEDVRKETVQRKCYDPANFATYFKYNKTMFDNFKTYDKNNPNISLSSEGKSRLAEIIKTLQ